MGKYIVYIELHDADSSDYENLYKYMVLEGEFSNKINDDYGNSHNITSNVIYYIDDSNLNQGKVFDYAKNAVERTSLKYSIIVAKTEFITLYNLRKD